MSTITLNPKSDSVPKEIQELVKDISSFARVTSFNVGLGTDKKEVYYIQFTLKSVSPIESKCVVDSKLLEELKTVPECKKLFLNEIKQYIMNEIYNAIFGESDARND